MGNVAELNGKLKQWRGLIFPESEKHLIEWMTSQNQVRGGLPAYQLHKYEAALMHCRKRRVAVDVGANIGLWSRVMALDFSQVTAFEPVGIYADCWRRNVTSPKAVLHQLALGPRPGTVNMIATTANSCGDTTVNNGQSGLVVDQVEMRTLDSYELQCVDLLKADNEGYELFVMQGAQQTLKRCKPVVIVEQKPGHGATFGLSDTAAVDFLEDLGMKVWRVISGDYILTF